MAPQDIHINAQLGAVVFDLDGTLVHSSPDIAHHLNAALNSHLGGEGLATKDVEMLIGGGLMELISKGFAALGAEPDPKLFTAVLEKYRASYLDAPVLSSYLYDGVADLLDDLHKAGVKIGLCTNKTETAGRAVLAHFGITDYFGAIIGGDTMAERKPHAMPLLEVLRQLQVDPDRAVMVGDSKADVGAAANADVASIAVDWGYTNIPPANLGANALISNYGEFRSAVESAGLTY